jgi:hypothetical protein
MAPLLDKQGTNRIQSISGTFLYYGRACDPCILPALNEIASEQAKPTTGTIPKTGMPMDYLHTYPNAVIRYHASDMILKITSDAAYLVQPKAGSRAAVHYHLGWLNSDRINGAVDVLCQTIKNFVSSAVEAETGGIYIGPMHAPCEPCSKNSVIASHRPDRLSTPTTTLPKAFSIPKCAKSCPNPSTCDTGE